MKLDLYNDSNSLFDVVIRGTGTHDRRLMIDLSSLQEAYHNFVICQFYKLRSDQNPSDVFIKLTHNDVFDALIATNRLNHETEITADRSIFDTDGANASSGERASVNQADTVCGYSDDEACGWYLERQGELAYASDNLDEYEVEYGVGLGYDEPMIDLEYESFEYLILMGRLPILRSRERVTSTHAGSALSSGNRPTQESVFSSCSDTPRSTLCLLGSYN